MARQGRERRPDRDEQRGEEAPDGRGAGEMDDREGQAAEEGEPSETNRSRGRVIDESGAGPQGTARNKPGEEDFESGRHQATPD